MHKNGLWRVFARVGLELWGRCVSYVHENCISYACQHISYHMHVKTAFYMHAKPRSPKSIFVYQYHEYSFLFVYYLYAFSWDRLYNYNLFSCDLIA